MFGKVSHELFGNEFLKSLSQAHSFIGFFEEALLIVVNTPGRVRNYPGRGFNDMAGDATLPH